MAEMFLSLSFVNVEPDPVEQHNIMRKIHCGVGTENMSKHYQDIMGEIKQANLFPADGIFHRYTLEYVKWSNTVQMPKHEYKLPT